MYRIFKLVCHKADYIFSVEPAPVSLSVRTETTLLASYET